MEKFRFRYKSEMHGTHGALTGQNASRTNKSFPTVRLMNYHGPAKIRCSLFQVRRAGYQEPTPHSHSLVIRRGNDDQKDPHEIDVSQSQGYTAKFQGMGIIHTARKYIEGELLAKLRTRAGAQKLDSEEMRNLEKRANREAPEMNLNQVCLCFEALESKTGKWESICNPVYSTAINNMSKL